MQLVIPRTLGSSAWCWLGVWTMHEEVQTHLRQTPFDLIAEILANARHERRNDPEAVEDARRAEELLLSLELETDYEGRRKEMFRELQRLLTKLIVGRD